MSGTFRVAGSHQWADRATFLALWCVHVSRPFEKVWSVEVRETTSSAPRSTGLQDSPSDTRHPLLYLVSYYVYKQWIQWECFLGGSWMALRQTSRHCLRPFSFLGLDSSSAWQINGAIRHWGDDAPDRNREVEEQNPVSCKPLQWLTLHTLNLSLPDQVLSFQEPLAYSKLRRLLFLNAGWAPSCSKRGPSFSPQSPLLSLCQGWHVGLFPRAQWEHSWVVRQVSSGRWSRPALLLLRLEKAPGRLTGCSVCQVCPSPSSGVWAEPSSCCYKWGAALTPSNDSNSKGRIPSS